MEFVSTSPRKASDSVTKETDFIDDMKFAGTGESVDGEKQRDKEEEADSACCVLHDTC